MHYFIGLTRLFAIFGALSWASAALAIDIPELPADDPGQADLDKATQTQLSASKLSDYSQVVELCEKAEKKGLDAGNKKIADALIASALQERGARYADLAIAGMIRAARAPAAAGEIGKIDSWKADRKAALADLERSVRLSPKQPRALFFIARLNLLPGGDASRAAEALDQSIAAADDDVRVKAEGLLLRYDIGKDGLQRVKDLDEAVRLSPGEPGALRARAALHAEEGKFNAALDDADKALEIDPKDLACYQIKTIVLVNQKKYDEAMKTLETGLKYLPDNPDLLVNMARVAIGKGDSQAAMGYLDKALAVAPKSVELRSLRAALFREMGDGKKVLAEIDKLLELQPDSADFMRQRAVLLSQLGRPKDALAEFEKLHAAEPNDALTQMQLGLLYTAAKKYPKAVEMLTAVLTSHPKESLAWRMRADAYLNMGQREKAVADYDRALRLQPGDVSTLNNLAWVLATAPEKELRDGERAVTLATDACKKTEYKEDYILSTLAAAYAEQGKFDEAKKWAAKAVELSAKDHGGEIKKELQSYTDKKPWREALSLDKNDANSQAASGEQSK